MLKFKSSCKPFLSIKSSNLWLESDSNPSPLIRVHTSVLRYFSQWHCYPKLFCLDHITRGSTQGRLCFCITSLKTTSLNPLPFIASPPPKCLFFFFFLHFQPSSHYCCWDLYVGSEGGMVPHSRGFYFSLGLLSAQFLYLQTEPSGAVATANH